MIEYYLSSSMYEQSCINLELEDGSEMVAKISYLVTVRKYYAAASAAERGAYMKPER
jgi:hypothetical protein